MTDPEIRELRSIAAQLRVNILRMIQIAGSGHPGGSLSAIDIVAYLYFRHMRCFVHMVNEFDSFPAVQQNHFGSARPKRFGWQTSPMVS